MQAIYLGVVKVVGRLAGLTHLVPACLIQNVGQACISVDGVQVFSTGLVQVIHAFEKLLLEDDEVELLRIADGELFQVLVGLEKCADLLR